MRYLAYVDGEPVAQATAAFSEHGVTLFGGATLPAARGEAPIARSSRPAGRTRSRAARPCS